MSWLENLTKNGYSLPPVPKSLAAYVPAVVSGNLVFTSGQLPLVEGNLGVTGQLGKDVSIADAEVQAGIAVLNALSAIHGATGSLDRVVRILKLGVYVACVPDFDEQHIVANGASAILQKVFGESGRHARFAVGVASLPLSACVELELLAEIQN